MTDRPPRRAVDDDADLRAQFGALLKESLTATVYGVTQQEAAHRLGVNRNTLGSWCRGDTLIPSVTIERLGEEFAGRIPPHRISDLIDLRAELGSGPRPRPRPTERDRPPVDVGLPDELTVSAPDRLVGRDRELDLLARTIEMAEGGTPQLVLVTGEAGIGKTALAASAAKQAGERGAIVLFGRCDAEISVPYEPFTSALAPLYRSRPEDELEGLALYRGAPSDRSWSDPDTERFHAFNDVGRLLEDASADRAVVLVLDDLHWAARPALLLLRHLAGRAGHRAVILATVRDTTGDLPDATAATLADLRSRPGTTVLRPRPLDRGEVGQLVDGRAGDVDDLVTRSGGNPFFLVQLLSQTDGPDDDSAPDGVSGALERRLATVSPDTRAVLRIAAVAGHQFPLAVVESACRRPVLDELDEATGAGLLREIPGDGMSYAFNHGLVRDAVLSGISAARRARLHRQIADALEERWPLPPEPPVTDGGFTYYRTRYSRIVGGPPAHAVSALAHHMLGAVPDGAGARAARCAYLGARYGLATGALEDAMAFARGGLAALRSTGDHDPRAMVRLLIVLRETANELGDTDSVAAAEAEAVAVARRAGDPVCLGWLAVAIAGVGPLGAGDLPTALCQEALAGLDALNEGDSSLRAAVMGILALSRGLINGEGGTLDMVAEDAAAMSRRVGDELGLLFNLWILSSVLHGDPSFVERRRAIVEEMHRLAARTTHYAHYFDLQQANVLALETGRGQEFARGIEQSVERLQDDGDLGWPAGFVAMGHGVAALLAGRFADATAAADKMIARGGTHSTIVLSGLYIQCRAALEQGEHQPAVEILQGISGAIPSLSIARAALAAALLDAGEPDRAEQILHELAADGFATVHRDWTLPASLGHLTEVAVAVGTPAHRVALADLLDPYRGRQLVLAWGAACLGAADRYLGMLLAADRRFDEAVDRYTDGLALETGADAPALATRTRLWLARALLARDAPTDAARGRELALQVSRDAAAMDMKRLATEAAALAE